MSLNPAEKHPETKPQGAVLFDLDGTLADTAPDIAAAVDEMLTVTGHAPAGLPAVRGWIGDGAERLVARALAHALGRQPEPDRIADGVTLFLDHYAGRLVDQSRCYPGMEQLLHKLSDTGVTLGCVTNKPEAEARAVLKGLQIAPLFGSIVGGNTTAARKPSPQPISHALLTLGVPPADTFMVGDSDNDLLAAAAAGVPAIWVGWGYQARPSASPGSYVTARNVPALEGLLASASSSVLAHG